MVTLTAELAESRQENSAASQRAVELEQQLQDATTATEQLRRDLEAAQAATECAAASEGAARATEQSARQHLETCRSVSSPTRQCSANLLRPRVNASTSGSAKMQQRPSSVRPWARVVMRSCLSCMLTLHGMHHCLPDAGTSWQLSRLTWKGTQHA